MRCSPLRDHPSDLGQRPDSAEPDPSLVSPDGWGVTRAVALRTPFFWVLTSGIAVSGLLSTAIGFHQISLLTARGLTATEAAANFLPQTAASLVGTLAVGAIADRARPQVLFSASMASLATGLLLGVTVRPGLSAIVFGVLIAAAGGSVWALEAITFARHFGTRHLGAIRGVVTAISVGSTAFGPLLFATLHDTTGTYTAALLACIPLPVLVVICALLIAPPHFEDTGADNEQSARAPSSPASKSAAENTP